MTTPTDQMTARPTGWTVTVPPGTYWVGDPCYAVPDDQWQPLLDSCCYFGLDPAEVDHDAGHPSPIGTLPDGHQILAFGTAHGDGTYPDQIGRGYSVDSGMIGLTPETVITRPHTELQRLGWWLTLTAPNTCETDGNGHLRFGSIRIDTNDDADYVWDATADDDDDWADPDWEDG